MDANQDFRKPILCFGELLWDSLPHGLFPGGAPLNVAYHLQRLGRRALPITAVGTDFLGQELLRRLKWWDVDARFVTVLEDKATGVVQVSLDANGAASYRILEDVAWDWIRVSDELLEVADSSLALIYGTLAQRGEHNRQQFTRLLRRTTNAYKVFDVNLRPPFDEHELVWQLAAHADLIKLNAEELSALLHDPRLRDSATPNFFEEAARRLAARIGCSGICVTASERGAGLLLHGRWQWAEGRAVAVKDTVGAGDAFLAGLIHNLLILSPNPTEALERACRLGEFVAASTGATPFYSISREGEICSNDVINVEPHI